MGDKRVLLGNKGSEYGLWVTKTGVDIIDDSPTDDELLFDSSKVEGSLILKSGTASSSWISWGTTLNYIPLVILLGEPVRKGYQQRWYQSRSVYFVYGLEHSNVYAEVTNTQFRVINGTRRYIALAMGGSTITSVGP